LIDLILHHYDFSNYSEKVRLALGYKELAWGSVTIPPTVPKPDLTPLTGGYRRTPILQVGADIYCDTALILRELERRFPTPTLYPMAYAAEGNMIAYWAENQLFRPMSLYVSGSNLDVLPKNLQADRSQMWGLPIPSDETVRRAAKRNAPAVRVQIRWIEDLLSDGRDWIAGPAVTVADLAVYHALWFLTARTDRLGFELDGCIRIREWRARVQAFGNGAATGMSSNGALDVAASSQPANPLPSEHFEEDPPLGSEVCVRAADYGCDPVEGKLVQLDRDQMAILRDDPVVGNVVVHFPKLGYDLRTV
jgi:glutathione S-transferase